MFELGLDAAVCCRCWEDGLCAPTRFQPNIYVEVDGFPNIDLPWETFEKEIMEFDQWVYHACAHPGMKQASEHIGNWSGIRQLRNAFRTANEEGFPNLLREIPNNNGGITLPDAARACMDELDRFETVGDFGSWVQLLDSETGSMITERTGVYDGWFKSNGRTGYEFKLETDGHLCIHHAQSGVVFRAKEFSQSEVSDSRFAFVNLLDGTRYVCPDGIQDWKASSYPKTLRGVVGPDSTDRYAYTIKVLRRVFSAAVEVSHPVSWR